MTTGVRSTPMTDESVETGHDAMLSLMRKAMQALCLTTMVAGFITLGALVYQGWKLWHNPYHKPRIIALAPSPDAAKWAADVYRMEKHAHLFHTGIFEAGLITLSAGAWLAYRKLDRRLEAARRSRHAEQERPRVQRGV